MVDIQRNTVQRQIVLATLAALGNHPTVEEVHAETTRAHPAISKTTIYRNLRELAKAGVISQVELPDGLERYDHRADPHYHFECQTCGRVCDIDIGYLADMDAAVRSKYGFAVARHDVVFKGSCAGCEPGR